MDSTTALMKAWIGTETEARRDTSKTLFRLCGRLEERIHELERRVDRLESREPTDESNG